MAALATSLRVAILATSLRVVTLATSLRVVTLATSLRVAVFATMGCHLPGVFHQCVQSAHGRELVKDAKK